MQVAFTPRFVGALDELPIVEAGAKAAGHGLGLAGAVVVAEAVVGQTQGLRQHPAFAVVLVEERLGTALAIARRPRRSSPAGRGRRRAPRRFGEVQELCPYLRARSLSVVCRANCQEVQHIPRVRAAGQRQRNRMRLPRQHRPWQQSEVAQVEKRRCCTGVARHPVLAVVLPRTRCPKAIVATSPPAVFDYRRQE